MKCMLVTNKYLSGAKYDVIVEHFANASKYLSIEFTHRYNDEISIGMDVIDDKPNFVIFWDKDLMLARYIESMGIPVLNTPDAIRVCDDKRLTTLALLNKVPMPNTVIAPMTYANVGYTDREYLDNVEENLSYPMVIKEAFGSYGRGVYLANNRDELDTIVSKIGSTPHIYQEFVSTSRGRDIRIQVVGDEVVASMMRINDNDFRANITNGGSMAPYSPTEEEKKLAIQSVKILGLDFAGVDILFGQDTPLVCEVNSNAHFDNLYKLTGVNTAKRILEYAIDKVSYTR